MNSTRGICDLYNWFVKPWKSFIRSNISFSPVEMQLEKKTLLKVPVSFFTFQQAKALKRQLKTEKQKAEEDSKKATTEKVPCIPAKSGVASDPPKNSLFIQRASSDRTDNQTAANRNNNREKDEEVKVQVKTGFPSFSFAKESCVKSREAPTQTSTLPATANSHFDNTNNNALGSNYNNTDNDKRNSIGNSVNNDNKNSKDSNTNNDDNNNSSKKIELIESNELENVASSSQITAESSLHNTRPAETLAPASTKPLRERQLQPLPHFGNVIPPPLEFSENSGESKFKLFTKEPHPPCRQSGC